MGNEEKECPFCAEIIKINAIKCKHCGSMLETFNEEINNNDGIVANENNDKKRLFLVYTSTFSAIVMNYFVNFAYGDGYEIIFMVNVVSLIFLIYVHYIDKKYLPQNISSQLPFYTSPIITAFFPYISLPLYFSKLKQLNQYSGNVFLVSLPWILHVAAFLFNIIAE